MDEEAGISVPLPLPISVQHGPDKCRLWIGNLDLRLREYQLLKMVEKFGDLVEFDFLYHRSGPQNGQPRGYAFVTFKNHADATRAQAVLDGIEVIGRKMAVKWAHVHDEDKYENIRVRPAPTVLSAGSTKLDKKMDSKIKTKENKIAELEAKLKLLESPDTDNLTLQADMGSGTDKPTSITYTFIERKSRDQSSRKYKSSGPYHRTKSYRK